MTHFRTLVILPKGQNPKAPEEVNDALRPILAPYDEAIEVAPYVDEEGDETTYSPCAHWDYWQVGGRYSGHFTADGRNVFPVHELDPSWSALVVVTPDGAWHTGAERSYYDVAPSWRMNMYELASAFAGHTGVCVDCHI